VIARDEVQKNCETGAGIERRRINVNAGAISGQPGYFDDDPRCGQLASHFVRKPIYSREGSNITLRDGDKIIGEEGS
jgi:hypothetical protein